MANHTNIVGFPLTVSISDSTTTAFHSFSLLRDPQEVLNWSVHSTFQFLLNFLVL